MRLQVRRHFIVQPLPMPKILAFIGHAAVASGFNKIPWISWSPDSQWIFPGQFRLWKPEGSLGYRFHHLSTDNPTIGWSPDSSQLLLGASGLP